MAFQDPNDLLLKNFHRLSTPPIRSPTYCETFVGTKRIATISTDHRILFTACLSSGSSSSSSLPGGMAFV